MTTSWWPAWWRMGGRHACVTLFCPQPWSDFLASSLEPLCPRHRGPAVARCMRASAAGPRTGGPCRTAVARGHLAAFGRQRRAVDVRPDDTARSAHADPRSGPAQPGRGAAGGSGGADQCQQPPARHRGSLDRGLPAAKGRAGGRRGAAVRCASTACATSAARAPTATWPARVRRLPEEVADAAAGRASNPYSTSRTATPPPKVAMCPWMCWPIGRKFAAAYRARGVPACRPSRAGMDGTLAQAARQSITMLDGRFVDAPFPQALPE